MIASFRSVGHRSTRNNVRFALLRHTALAGGVIAGMMVFAPLSAVAQTGGGGGASRVDFDGGDGSNMQGGASNLNGSGGAGASAPSSAAGGFLGGGGGGAGATGGQGGQGAYGAFGTGGGLGGLTPGGWGANGGDGPGGAHSISGTLYTNRSGGGGGGGGAHGYVGSGLPTSAASGYNVPDNLISGGRGGNGGNGFIDPSNSFGIGHGGGGGAGGYGAVLTGSGDLGTLSVNVSGGRGGNGGRSFFGGGNSSDGLGGSGGIGIAFTDNAAITINTTVQGGASGGPQIPFGDNRNKNFLNPGVGISGSVSGLQLTLGATAVVKGGEQLNEIYWSFYPDNGPRTTAIVFNGTSTNNRLTVTDGAVITGGILIADANGKLELYQATDATLSAVISGAGSVTKTGVGILTLTGANVYTGTTTVSAGTLRLGAGGSLSSSSVVTVASGATFDFGATQQNLTTIGGLGSGSYGGSLNVTSNIDETATADLGGTTFALTKDGTGVLTLSGNLTFGGQTLISGGTLNLTGNNTLTGGIVVNGKLIVGSNNAAGGAGNTITTTGSVIGFANGVNSATPININSNTTQLEVLNTDAATQSGVISETAGPRGFEKIGTGTLTLAANNTYSGVTVISAGTLVAGSTFVGVTPTAALGNNAATNIVRLNGGTLQIDNQVATFARPVEITALNGTLNNVAALTLNGMTTFTGALTKTGAGNLTLNGAGTGAGGLIFNSSGTLEIGSNSALGTGTLRMQNGGTLLPGVASVSLANAIVVDAATTVSTPTGRAMTLSGAISGAGSLTKVNPGTLDLTGANSFTGGITLGGGTLGVGSNTALGTGAVSAQVGTTLRAVANATLANNIVVTQGMGGTQFTVDTNGNNLTLNGVISTNVPQQEQVQPGLTKAGAGVLTLNGTNTYRGPTIVNAGKLTVNGSIANTSSVTIADGATMGGNAAIPNLTVHNGASLSPGNSIGTVNIAGNLTLNASSTTVIEIQQAQVDKINAGGTAALAGTLQLVALGGPYNFGTPYNFLTATGGINGTFATVNTDAAFGVGVTSAVSYNANNAFVTLTAAPLVTQQAAATANAATTTANTVLGLSQTRNINAVASALDRAAFSGADVSSLFNIYNQPTREALAAAVNTLSGEVHTATSAAGLRASDQFLRVMLDPFAIGRDGSLVGTSGYSGYTADLPGRKGPVSAPAPVRFEPTFHVWGATFGQIDRTKGDATGAG